MSPSLEPPQQGKRESGERREIERENERKGEREETEMTKKIPSKASPTNTVNKLCNTSCVFLFCYNNYAIEFIF
jgi:hypothetical protein